MGTGGSKTTGGRSLRVRESTWSETEGGSETGPLRSSVLRSQDVGATLLKVPGIESKIRVYTWHRRERESRMLWSDTGNKQNTTLNELEVLKFGFLLPPCSLERL